MSECKVYRREFEGATDGGALSAEARTHAASCRACGEDLRARASLRALVGGLGKVEAPADFEFRLRARMAAAKGTNGRSGGIRLIYGFAPVAVAACFLVVSTTLYFRQAAPKEPAAPPSVAESARRAGPEPAPTVSNQAGASKDVDEVGAGASSASLKSRGHASALTRGRARQSGEVASKPERRTSPARSTNDYSFTSARVIRPEGVFALKASAEPLRMIMRDERGAERVVPMRAVSFGSQDLLAREAVLGQAGVVKIEGVW